VRFISINTMNPEGQVDVEIKRYKMEYPVYYGRGQNLNRDFKVEKLPRLVIVRADSTIYKDVQFMKGDALKAELDSLLQDPYKTE
jgi:hypothetical protein